MKISLSQLTLLAKANELGLDEDQGKFAVGCVHGEHVSQNDDLRVTRTMRSFIYDCCKTTCSEDEQP